MVEPGWVQVWPPTAKESGKGNSVIQMSDVISIFFVQQKDRIISVYSKDHINILRDAIQVRTLSDRTRPVQCPNLPI